MRLHQTSLPHGGNSFLFTVYIGLAKAPCFTGTYPHVDSLERILYSVYHLSGYYEFWLKEFSFYNENDEKRGNGILHPSLL